MTFFLFFIIYLFIGAGLNADAFEEWLAKSGTTWDQTSVWTFAVVVLIWPGIIAFDLGRAIAAEIRRGFRRP